MTSYEPPNRAALRARSVYLALFATPRDAELFEEHCLAGRFEDLPECAQSVAQMLPEDPSADYWRWLTARKQGEPIWDY